MELHLKIIGTIFMLMALGHIFMPKYFDWKNDFKNLSLFNGQMIRTHTFFIALFVFGIGLISFMEATQIINTDLGNKLSLGFGIIWLTRFYFQMFVYLPKLWKGKRFETSAHLIFTLLWIYSSFIYLKIGLNF